MFLQPSPKSELRVIDFGSGVMDDPNAVLEEGAEFGRHTTFAGSAFYISPEMFQRFLKLEKYGFCWQLRSSGRKTQSKQAKTAAATQQQESPAL